ncbi:MAG: hypothetical protein ABI611_17975 [Solirubrobacteraceae bacterium]
MVEDGAIDLDALALVWMDVHGHEAHVLAGAGRLLAARIPASPGRSTRRTSSAWRSATAVRLSAT